MSSERRLRALALLGRLERLAEWVTVEELASVLAELAAAQRVREAHEAALAVPLPRVQRSWHFDAAIASSSLRASMLARRALAERSLRQHQLRRRGLERLARETEADLRRARDRRRLADVLDAHHARRSKEWR